MKTIAVIGGGITGVTTAYALARRGFAVTVIERHRYAGMETSFANGGQLSASNAEVWNHRSTLLKGLKWMFTRDAPLLVNPTPSWHKLSWFAEFAAAIPHYRRNTIETTRLAIAAREHLFAWAHEEAIDFDARREGILHIYRDRAGFDHAAKVNQMLAQGGLERRAVTPAEMRAIEPTLAGNFYGGFYTDSDSTGDIHKFTVGLAAAAARKGVVFQHGQAVRAVHADGRRIEVTLGEDAEPHGFDGVVICAGTASRALATSLGDRVNVYPVKGYSITVNLNDANSQAAAPTVSLLDDETKLVTSRLGLDRFRVAGTAEFNGFNRDIRADRIRPAGRLGPALLPRREHAARDSVGRIAADDADHVAARRRRPRTGCVLQHGTRPSRLDLVSSNRRHDWRTSIESGLSRQFSRFTTTWMDDSRFVQDEQDCSRISC